MAAAAELAKLGWHLSEEFRNGLGNKVNIDSIVKKALDTDLKEVGTATLSEDISRGRADYIEGPCVLQLSKLRIVSAPKDNEDSQAAPKIYRLSLTDGHVTCSAVTLEPIQGLGLNTPPGSKLRLSGTIEVETSFLLLTSKNTSLLGGRVSTLADTWELKKTLAKQSLARANLRGEGGPPPFVPFGKKITAELVPPPRKDNFKSLGGSKEKKISEGDSEFEQQRQAALNEALQAKGSNRGGKTFGGGKFLVNDKDLAKIIDMGFSIDEATSALKSSSGNVNEAINSLLSGGPRFQRGMDRGRPGMRGGMDGRSDGRRRGRDRDLEYDGDEPINARPSGPATLFDFLETKIPAKDDFKKLNKSSDVKIPPAPSSSVSNDQSFKFPKDHTNDRFQRRPQTYDTPSSGPDQYRSNYKDDPIGYQDSSRKGRGENNFSYRGPPTQHQQSVPPRFAKLGRGDGQRTGGAGRSEGGGGGYRGGEDRYGGSREDGNESRLDRYGGSREDGNESRLDRYGGSREGGNESRLDRYGGSREGGNESRLDSYSNHNQASLKENIQNQGGRSPQNFSGPSRDIKPQSIPISEPQTEKRHYHNDQFNSDATRQPVNETGSDSRNNYRNNYGDPGARQDSGGYRQQNYGHSQNRNSSRNDNRYGPSEPPRGQANNRSYSQQPPLMPTPYAHQLPQDPQYAPVSGKPGYDDRQFNIESSFLLNVGDNCLAKYWDDNKFYPAIVEAISLDVTTAVVRYIDYGNCEEVLVEDVQPLNQPTGWAYQVPVYGVSGVNPPLQNPPAFPAAPSFVPPMEFSRSSSYYNSNNAARRQDTRDRRRPTQVPYLPPNQRSA